jgi:hypothetical protein
MNDAGMGAEMISEIRDEGTVRKKRDDKDGV